MNDKIPTEENPVVNVGHCGTMNQGKNTVEMWERLFKDHRGTELAILYLEALRIGLRNGQITAEDLHHIKVVNPNVRGACMRGLRRAGMFIKTGTAYGTTTASHGHMMSIWRLEKPSSARKLLESVARKIDGTPVGSAKETQATFC